VPVPVPVPVDAAGSERGGVFGSAGLRSERLEGKFLILMRSVDIFLRGLRSGSGLAAAEAAAACAEVVRRADMVWSGESRQGCPY
jgi:hypothetical protein